jgi:hypothetical protein
MGEEHEATSVRDGCRVSGEEIIKGIDSFDFSVRKGKP